SYGTAGGGVFSGPGFVQVYMRGVVSGGDGNHSASQPSVGVYLDEQPITSASGSLDIHMYDIERVEALAGPQGTLYGASSQSGTLRIITNKPDPSAFASGYGVEFNAIEDGGIGHVAEGFANIPINDHTAIRLVGWEKNDAGYVDNVRGTRTFPTSGITIDNANRVDEDYNDAHTFGARAALRLDLNDSWSITPAVMAQKLVAGGSRGYDPSVGDLAVKHFYPESSKDRWVQAALTVEGKIGNFDLVYAFSHLKRDVDSEADYNDYGFWYDTLAGYGAYFYDDNGDLINPAQYIQAFDGYRKRSHELRISSPAEHRIRFVGGLFWQQQDHEIFQRYRVDNLATSISVPGFEDTIWLTSQERSDRDEAVFGEVSFDITDQLTVTGGARHFKARNGLKGFYGFGAGFSGSTGESQCFSQEDFNGAPCINLDKETSEKDTIGRFNVTYEIDDTKLIYATWSEGYRPGGINRRGTLAPYMSDFLTNYELGWKTSWANNRLTLNGAVFRQDWDDFQFAYLGQNGLTEIRNAAQAQIDGVEIDLNWAATYNLRVSGGFAWYDAKLTKDYCAQTDANGVPVPDCYLPSRPFDRALAGSRLPVTPEFKGNLTGRYTWDVAAGEAHFQAAVFHQGDRTTDLREAQRELLGDLDAYTLTDLSAGFRRNNWSLDFYLKNAFDKRTELARFAQCPTLVCGFQPYTVSTQPRTFGIRFSQEF
ncbi:MAG: TonB-dependent receptor, partial [Lysobacter sp.]|nr:TonB-dependent receptor [Lysobacter sp.]